MKDKTLSERMADCDERRIEIFNEELEKVGGDNCLKAESRMEERLKHEHF